MIKNKFSYKFIKKTIYLNYSLLTLFSFFSLRFSFNVFSGGFLPDFCLLFPLLMVAPGLFVDSFCNGRILYCHIITNYLYFLK